MSNTRSVIVASPAANKAKKYETSATTWGQLKVEIAELIVGNVEAVLLPGNHELKRDDATLPNEDFRVYLIPAKNKAGFSASEAQEVGKAIAAAIVEAAAKVSVNELNELKHNLIEEVENFFGVNLSDDCPECDGALQEALKMGRS